jgi:ribose-phosphate pyrophosphokinase
MPKSILVASARYGYLAEAIRVACPGMFEEEVWLHRDHFKDGERYHRWLKQIDRRDIVIVGGTIDDTEFMEVCDIISMSHQYGADHVTLIIPCFGYQTMERAVEFGEDVKAKNRARMLSYLPRTRGGLTVAMFDLHADGIAHYFENNVVTTHLYSKSLVKSVVDGLKGQGELVMGATDAGRAKWVDSLAREWGLGVGFVLKNRPGKDRTEVMMVSASVRGCNVFMFDDMLRTGTTGMNAARAYRSKGAKLIWLMCTHGFAPGDTIARLQAEKDRRNKPLFAGIILIDSHPRALEVAAENSGYVTLIGSAPVFSNYLVRGTGF